MGTKQEHKGILDRQPQTRALAGAAAPSAAGGDKLERCRLLGDAMAPGHPSL